MGQFLHAPRLGLIALLLSVSGCAARYHEPPRADKQAAVIEAVAPIWVVSIDHAQVSRVGITGHKQFRISPGDHALEVEYSMVERDTLNRPIGGVSSKEPLPVHFTAAPGRTYYIRSGRISNRWGPFVTDSLQPDFPDPKLN